MCPGVRAGGIYLNFLLSNRLEIGLFLLRALKLSSDWNPFYRIEFKMKLISTFVSNINESQHLPKT